MFRLSVFRLSAFWLSSFQASSERLASRSVEGTKNKVPVTGLEKSRRRSVFPTGSPMNMFSSMRLVVENFPA